MAKKLYCVHNYHRGSLQSQLPVWGTISVGCYCMQFSVVDVLKWGKLSLQGYIERGPNSISWRVKQLRWVVNWSILLTNASCKRRKVVLCFIVGFIAFRIGSMGICKTFFSALAYLQVGHLDCSLFNGICALKLSGSCPESELSRR